MNALFQKKENGGVKCGICPHKCLIAEGKYGACGARANIDGTLQMISFPTSIALDPIEKKPLYHFYPGSTILSAGTQGCNLKCQFCQNWTISQAKAEVTFNRITPDVLINTAEKARGQGNIGIAYTYNEPTVWFEYIYETAAKAREHGLKNVLVTNGYMNPKPQRQLLKFIDAVNLDIKSIDNKFYRNICRASLAPVLKYAEKAKDKAFLEITNLIIPTLNDSEHLIKKLAQWISHNLGNDTPLHLSAYFPAYKSELPPTPPETLRNAYNAASEYLDYVYIGNLRTDDGLSTCCPSCKKAVIIRRRMSLLKDLTKNGCCPHCGTKINIYREDI